MAANVVMHNWNLSPKEAIELQKKLRSEVKLVPLAKPPSLIGGCDVSMNRFAKEGFAGFVVLNEFLQMVDHAVVEDTIPFPYIPGLLSFREIPMLLKAWEKLQTKPDVIVVDGVGIAHPRRLGIATHLGLTLDIPTIGVSKNVLYGKYEEPGLAAGSLSYMYDPKTGEKIGAALRTKDKVKPVFVSPGHLITLEEAIDVVRRCCGAYRIPEPTRLAHNTVNEYRVRGVY
jgi:deoxyribonuclease V